MAGKRVNPLPALLATHPTEDRDWRRSVMVDGFDEEPLPGIEVDRSVNDGRIPANVGGCRQRRDSDELEPVANHHARVWVTRLDVEAS